MILDTARQLFNEKGAASVTTNHIAEKCGISPGNLYYHFKNKEHIFLQLLEEMIQSFDEIYLPSADIDSIDAGAVLSKTCTVIYDYCFIYADLSYLITFDDSFRKKYKAIKEKRIKDFRLIISDFSQKGIVKGLLPDEELDIMVTIIWTYIEGIVTSLKTEGKSITLDSIEKSLQNIFILLKPYLG